MNRPFVQTVLGKIDPSQIRYGSSHEHLITYATKEIRKENPEMVLEDEQKISIDIELFKKAGGNTIVEMTTEDYGRDLTKLASLAKSNNINIIAATGFNKGKFHRSIIENNSTDSIINKLIDEVNNGLGEDKIKPGVIKIGSSLNDITPWEEKGIEIISQVSMETGIPISTHTQAGTMAKEQIEYFKHFNVDLKNVVLCHLDQNPNFDLHKFLLKQGVYLSYDSIPKPQYNTESNAIKFIIEFAKEGLHEQILIGGDFSRQKYFKGFGGDIGLDYILTTFKSKLEYELDVAGLDSRKITEDIFQYNLQKAFSFK